jgi:hypothetical protein
MTSHKVNDKKNNTSITNKVGSKNNNRTNWKEVIEEVKSSLLWFKQLGVIPTLRTMFYRLVSMEIISNTEQSYKSLSSTMVKARKTGEIPWDCISDQGRQVLVGLEEYTSPDDFVEIGVDYLKNAPSRYTIPRWHNQKYYVEVWIEKLAHADTFILIIGDRHVNIVVNRGYAGWSFLYENCKRLRKIKDEYNKFIHILYFGDCDPSGEDMDRHLRNAIEQFELQNDIDFRRVAVTLEQIKRFKLPPLPGNQETLDKLRKDTRTIKFKKKHGGKLYAVELDALLAVAPDEFRTMIQQSVDQFFDKRIYQKTLRAHPPEHIDRLVHQRVKFLD